MNKYQFVENPTLREYLQKISIDTRVVEGGKAIYLDRNEHPYNLFGQRYKQNRFIEPTLLDLRKRIAETYSVPDESIYIQNGHWQALDTILRVFFTLNKTFAHISPTFPYLQTLIALNNISKTTPLNYKEIQAPVNADFIFLANPNDPTSTLVENISGIVRDASWRKFYYVDERYIEFSQANSLINLASKTPGLVVLRSFAHSYALAGISISFVVAHPEIVEVLRKLNYPDNVSRVATQYLLEVLEGEPIHKESLRILRDEMKTLYEELKKMKIVEEIEEPKGNFLRVKFTDSDKVWQYLKDKKIFVHKNGDYLRISVGNPTENKYLIRILEKLC